MPLNLLLIALVNTAVGLLVGWSSIGGFLMPMFYVSVLQMDPTAALSLGYFSWKSRLRPPSRANKASG